MHSRSNSLENISEVNSSQMQAQAQQGESKSDEPTTSFQRSSRSCHRGPPENRSTVHQKHMTFCWGQTNNKNSKLTEQTTSLGNNKDLSHDDLLLLLSILEGELQARDEVITLLRADKIDLPLLEAQYGFVKPHKVLQALQRDTVQGKGHGWQEDIYEKPITELDKLVEKQQKAYTHMLEQLLLVEQAHKQTLYKLEDEKRNHSEYMKKSDDFTNLLEQERERLKILNDQEKACQKQKEEENKKKVTNLEDELTKLKSFALLVIDEQQCVTDQLVQETAKVQELQAAARVAQEELNFAQTRLQEMESKVMYLEAELHEQSVQFHEKQEAMCTKLTDENSQNRHLRQKLSTLCQELDELEESNKALHKTEKELQERRDRTSNGECGDSSLVSEVEELRKRVVEMKGKDEELIKMENLCRDLKRKLERESIQNHSLKAEVDKLSQRIIEFEKLEDAFGKSKEECSMLKCNLEKEMTVTKQMCSDLDILRVRVKELETAKALLDKTEWTLKDDLTKLKTLTVMLVDERKTMSEKLKQLENKVQNSADKLQGERDKVISVTEKLIEESKKALKIKVEMEGKICIVINERDDLKTKLKAEEEKNNAFQSKVSMMKRRLQSLEAVEREFLRNKAKKENMKESIQNGLQQEDNKVKDLIQEVEWLRKKRKEMKVGENDIPKTQNVGESLEEKYSKEKALKDELDITQRELSKYQLVEKEHFNQEHILYKKLKEEEAKSSHLTKEVEALKEKIHTYMGIEESMCNMKTKYATLQRKQTQQEVRNKELARETESLTKELERYRRFSKSLRPGMIGRRFSDLQVSTKEVQTEPTEIITSTNKNTDLLEQALVNGKMYDYSNQQNKPNCNAINPLSPSLNNRISHQNNTKQIINPNPNSKHIDKQQFINCKVQTTQNRTHNQQGDVLVTHIPNHLHIEVTPDQSHGTSPTTRNTQTYTTTTVIPTRRCATKQQSATVQNAPVSSHNKRCPSTDCHLTPGQSMSPISTTAYSQTVIHEFTSSLTTESAIASTEITTITEGVPEGAEETEVTAAMRCVTPQKQNNQHGHMYNSSIPSVNTNEDNRMHNHLGIPDIQTINSNAETPSLCFCPGQEQRTLQGTSGTPAKVNSKTSSSIRIKPVSTSILQPSQITVSTEAFQQSGPTRIPKPKACSMSTGTNSRVALIQNTGTAQSPPKLEKNIYSDLNTEDLITKS